MLEVCPSISATKPTIAVHPLGIGGKEDPARIIFNGKSGSALNASIVDLGHRFRLIVNEVDAIEPEIDMPNLPVARVLWRPQPSLNEGAENWILAGGAHHTLFSYKVTTEQLRDFAELVGMECVVINHETKKHAFVNELRWNDVVYK